MKFSHFKFKVVTEPHQCGRVFKAKALRESLEIIDLIIKTKNKEHFTSRLRRGTHYLLRYPQDELPTAGAKFTIVKDETRIFTTYAFHIPKEVEAAYYEAKLLTVPEADRAEKNTRLSLRGVIKNLSPITWMETCPRREFDLEEPDTSSSIKCTVLGRTCTSHLPEGSHATFTNLETTVFKGTVQVCTTPETVISVTEGDQTVTCEISAFDDMSNNAAVELLTEQGDGFRCYSASTDQIHEIIRSEDINDLVLLLPFVCTFTYCPLTASIKTIRST
ncbi:uncharacterized protein LOC117305297 [Asterias rubens]|uniref:uncharacterized protein LOC117305297 n=1 Tax=Asterias rubens TaxID=7604 RepID=UPI001455AAA6|nr:uncharacterized protein LOC117305297 [Asterias rubens]